MQELRYAVRALLKTPVFTVVVVLTLALGIGANTAIFSVVDAVLLRPLPYPEPERIVSFAWRLPSGSGPANVNPLTFQHWHQHAQAFDGFAVTSVGTVNMVVSGGMAERVRGVSGTADFFKVIGVSPALGRGFRPEETAVDGPLVTVMSHGMWQRVFGGAADAIGKPVTLNDRSYSVIGIMPRNFSYEPAVDVVSPLRLRVDPRDRGLNYTVIGRLRSGTTLAQAQSETDRLLQQFVADNPQHVPRNAAIDLIRFQDFLVADMQPLLLVFGAAVGLVLLIACGNVANLLLARSAAQQRELAIRTALGASMKNLMQRILAESLLLSLSGGIAGVALAAFGVRTLIALLPGQLPRLHDIAVDLRVLAFAFGISMMAGCAFGVLGAMRLLKHDPGGALKATTGTGLDRVRQRLPNALVVGQVALSVILLTGAGLLLATFVNLRGIRPGFETANLLTVQLPLSPAKLGSAAAIERFDRDLIDRISAIPGVVSVTTASSIPLERGPNFIIGIEGEPRDTVHYVEIRPVGPDYFRTLGIPLRVGRDQLDAGAGSASQGVVINEALATLVGGAEEALGDRVIIGRTTPAESAPREIVGVVSNVADGRPGTRLFPTLYLPRSQFGSGGMAAVLIRTSGSVPIASDVRRVIQAIDPQLPVASLRSMGEVASAAIAQQRFNVLLIGIFAAVALSLTMIGLYGVLSHQVARRTREIGVRMAIGAGRTEVLRMIVARGLILTVAGLTIGVAGSLGFARFLRTMLYGVSATSPGVFMTVAGVLVAVAFLASVIPGRRAMGVDPIVALRVE